MQVALSELTSLLIRQFVGAVCQERELPVLQMAMNVGVHGEYYLHPENCFHLKTGQKVSACVATPGSVVYLLTFDTAPGVLQRVWARCRC